MSIALDESIRDPKISMRECSSLSLICIFTFVNSWTQKKSRMETPNGG
jgi:hypothetical protein